MLMTKIIDEKRSLATFCLLLIALHKVTIIKRNFYPSCLFDDWETGPGDFLTAENEEASIFQAADFATNVADMFIELYC